FDTSTGAQLFKLTPHEPQLDDRFGNSVAISGNLAIIGAYTHPTPFRVSGAAYVFDLTTGQQLARLTAPDAAAFDQFGFDVNLEGTRAIVGAWTDDDLGVNSGSAYVFTVPEPAAPIVAATGLIMLSWTRRRTWS
ncbi:MAG TPA: FG-GAP repeat protein, partial [Lacipirellula sp.]